MLGQLLAGCQQRHLRAAAGAGEARLLCRKSTNAVEGLLGYAAEPEMIHRDNLVLRG